MAATSAYLRHEGPAPRGGLLMVAAVLGIVLSCGYTLAVGELAGLYVALSVAGTIAVLFDFRAGAVLLALMLPTAASTLFPHSLLEITGLNPLNVLLLATLAGYLVNARRLQPGSLLPGRLVWCYAVPIVIAGALGMRHVDEIPSIYYLFGGVPFETAFQYVLGTVVKPLVIVAVAVMIGAAAAASRQPERFILPIALSVWVITLIQFGFIVTQGASLALLASPDRAFYSPLGMHANDLGRLHLFAFALLLFVWAEARPGRRLFLLLTLGLAATALVLTFSRAAIAGAIIVGALFLLWKFNTKTLSLSLIAVVLAALLGADALYSRLTYGVGEGADAVSAGRIDGIWLPLLPELAKSPLWGNGMNSIMWSAPVVNGTIEPSSHPHNAYLEAMLDMGILGLGLLLAFYAQVWRGFRALGADETLTPEMRGLFQGATAALVAFFFTCVVGSSLRPEPESAYLWIAIGLMYGLRGRRPVS
jgi:O-antigen ligase